MATAMDGDEILSIEYDDNCIPAGSGKTTKIHAAAPKVAKPRGIEPRGATRRAFPFQ